MSTGLELLKNISSKHSPEAFRQEHWVGTFPDYLDISCQQPGVNRTAYQRLYDMVMSYGTYKVENSKEDLVRYKFFDDPDHGDEDNVSCLQMLMTDLLPVCNLYCYDQVKIPYGSRDYIRELKRINGKHENLVLSEIPNRDAIYDSIKLFLGKGK